jgi:hypothetical protein
MSKNILYNVVRENIPNSNYDDQGFMDIARQINTAWPSELSRLRFIGFRYTLVPNGSSLVLASNEMALLINSYSQGTITINSSLLSISGQSFGVIFNRASTSISGGCALQYALFTYQ